MIAAEHTLRNKKLLDSVAKTRHLAPTTENSEMGLRTVLTAIEGHLPADIKLFLDDAHYGGGTLVSGDRDRGVMLALRNMTEQTGERWVAATTVLHIPIETTGNTDVLHGANMRDAARELNAGSYGCVWTLRETEDEGEKTTALVRVSGTAAPIEASMHNWRNIVANMYLEAVRAHEEINDERGPAWWSLQLKNIAHTDEITGRDIHMAASRFRDNLDSKLQDVVSVVAADDGVGVVVPFRAAGNTYPLRITFSADTWGDSEKGLRILAFLYKPVERTETERYLSSFNGTDFDDTDDSWLITTPWSFGTWAAAEMPGERDILFYRGFIPSRMIDCVSLEEIIEGTLREVWATSDKHRLQEEFRETVGAIDGSF